MSKRDDEYSSIPVPSNPHVMWLNAYIVRLDVSTMYSWRVLICSLNLDFIKQCKSSFGIHYKVHKNISNSMQGQMHAAICFGAMCNLQGSSSFFVSTAISKLTWHKYMELSLLDSIISQVDKWERQTIDMKWLYFRKRNKVQYPFADDDLDKVLVEDKLETAVFPDIVPKLPRVDIEEHIIAPTDALEEPTEDEELNRGICKHKSLWRQWCQRAETCD